MKNLKGQNICLRALEPEDLDFIYTIENTKDFWEISNTQTPYSRFLIKQYLENAYQDIYEAKQLRLVIEHQTKAIGLIDLFDFDPKNERVGLGILLSDVNSRGKGFAKEALQLLIDYVFMHLQVHQIYVNIGENNTASLQLFANFGFEKIGIKKDWIKVNNAFQNEFMFQLLKK